MRDSYCKQGIQELIEKILRRHPANELRNKSIRQAGESKLVADCVIEASKQSGPPGLDSPFPILSLTSNVNGEKRRAK